ncbi:MAG: sel1 repeat family protein [Bacteroidales bacterium]|nr:sel1 repeat family protein [Bacteroidales bacterium]
MYENGQGVKQDYVKAGDWYKKAAEQGVASAQYYLGLMYDKGLGVKQDIKKAVKWYSKAAEQGHEQSINKLKIYRIINQKRHITTELNTDY